MIWTICNGAVDWSATGSMLQGLGTIAGVGAVVWATITGAKLWKQQRLMERKVEQAERILSATYLVRRDLARVRNGATWSHEEDAARSTLAKLPGWELETNAKKDRLVTREIFRVRINLTRDHREALDHCLPMAKALFSAELEEAMESLNNLFWRLSTWVDAYVFDHGADQPFSMMLRRAMNSPEQHEGHENELNVATDVSVATIERICLPALRFEEPTRRK